MRKKLNTTRLLASLVVPMLFACGGENQGGDNVLAVPQCDDLNQGITVKEGRMVCEPLPNGVQALQDCKPYVEALTSEGGLLKCDFRNNESQASRDALNNLSSSEKLINDYTTRLGKLTPGPGARAVYCGSTTATSNGQINAPNGLIGPAAAAVLCQAVQGCGMTPKMCSVYDLYYSVATGVITQGTGDLPSTTAGDMAWVYMASWQIFGSPQEPTLGMNDNCATYAYPTGDRGWKGTAFRWENASTGQKVLKFFSGAGISCNTARKIACCK